MQHLMAKTDSLPDLKVFVKDYNMVYYCKHCGSELMCILEYKHSSYQNFIAEQEVLLGLATAPDKIKELENKILEAKRKQKIGEDSRNQAQKAYAKAEKITKCPICGKPLRQEIGYFMPDSHMGGSKQCLKFFQLEYDGKPSMYGYPSSAEDKLKHMTTLRESIEATEAQRQAKGYVDSNDLPVFVTPAPAESIQSSPTELKKYVQTLLQLENNIYSLGQLLSSLYHRRLRNDRNVVAETYEPTFKTKAEIEELKTAYNEAVEEYKTAQTCKPGASVQKMKCPVEPKAPVLGTPNFFNKKKVLAENDRLTRDYQIKLEEYHLAVKRYNYEKERLLEKERNEISKKIEKAQHRVTAAQAAIDKAKALLEKSKKEMSSRIIPSAAAKELISKEIAEAEALLQKTLKARNELYAHNIIFVKYRNAVALASFYEYLMSGRCSSLEGADGAYNIYEHEIRLNRVISQLDTVISSLEEIKQNQFMMYSELRNIHSSLDRLNNTMDKALSSVQRIEVNTTTMNEHLEHISHNSDVIAHNTAVTAYFSKVNAELTNALGYMVAFN